MRTPKAVPVVLRKKDGDIEVLIFEHPEAGTQIVKGTVEQGESVDEACVRELAEESGVTDAECIQDLGTWEQCPRGQVWHFREVQALCKLPDSWSYFTQDGGGHLFRFSWHKLARAAPSTCHPVFVGALSFIQASLSAQLGARHQSAPLPSAP